MVLVPRSSCAPTPSLPTENNTVTVPSGIRNHGDPKILCLPSKWTNIITFFLTNFVTHAATVKSVPGEPPLSAALSIAFALLFPASGVVRALRAIYQYPVFANTALSTALRARALCMVVRTSRWEPQDGDVVNSLGFRITDKFQEAVTGEPGYEYLASDDITVVDHFIWEQTQEYVDLSKVGIKMRKLVGRCTDKLKRKSGGSVTSQKSNIPALMVNTLDTGYNGDHRSRYFIPSKSFWNRSGRKVHGVCRLPPGYALSIVRPETQILGIGEDRDKVDDLNEAEVSDKQGARSGAEYRTDGGCGREVEDQGNEDNWHTANERDDADTQGDAEDQRGEGPGDKNEAPSVSIGDYHRARVFKNHGYEHLQASNDERKAKLQARKDKRQEKRQERRQRSREKRRPHDFPTPDPKSCMVEVSSSYSSLKSVVAISQTTFASATLYRARGDQIQQYGYAAFGLAVAPYLIMSIVNLISNLLTPEYPAMYMLRSDIMDEASRRKGANFEGVVGTISEQSAASKSSGTIRFRLTDDGRMLMEHDTAGVSRASSTSLPGEFVMDDTWSLHTKPRTERPALLISSCSEPNSPGRQIGKEFLEFVLIGAASIYIMAISIAINGALSKFKPGHSTLAQRVWTMTWLAFGIMFGPGALLSETRKFNETGLLFYCAPSIGGFIVIGQMLMEYGYCIRL